MPIEANQPDAVTSDNVVREDSDFFSESERCAAWLYRPKKSSGGRVPVVVMAHGFAGERDFCLPAYAIGFADRGIAVLLFDYRHFGDSEGEPRNMVDHRRQHRDWLAAIAHAKTIEGLDGERIGLWGTSFSGGHVVAVAAEERSVRAIVSQVPMLDVPRALRIDANYFFAALWHVTRDCLRAILGRPPHYIRTVAPPSQFAALNREGCDEGYRRMVPAGKKWSNECTARSLLSSAFFRPNRKARLVKCPALFVIAEHDQVIRTSVIEQVASKMPGAEIIRYPVDHFGVYHGKVFEEVRRLQADFFARHLDL